MSKVTKIRNMTETQVDNKCEELFSQIMKSIVELKKMYTRLKEENLLQDDKAYYVYKASLMIEHIEDTLFPEGVKDEMYRELKEWEHYENTIREHAMDSFHRFLEKGA
jgi:hypothetical protein